MRPPARETVANLRGISIRTTSSLLPPRPTASTRHQPSLEGAKGRRETFFPCNIQGKEADRGTHATSTGERKFLSIFPRDFGQVSEEGERKNAIESAAPRTSTICPWTPAPPRPTPSAGPLRTWRMRITFLMRAEGARNKPFRKLPTHLLADVAETRPLWPPPLLLPLALLAAVCTGQQLRLDGRMQTNKVVDVEQHETATPPPQFVSPVPNITVAVGRDAVIPCVVKNLHDYKVAFVHLDRQMILTIHTAVITRIPRFSITHDKVSKTVWGMMTVTYHMNQHHTWSLHIRDVQKEDRGHYMCQINTDPMLSDVGVVDVVGKGLNGGLTVSK